MYRAVIVSASRSATIERHPVTEKRCSEDPYGQRYSPGSPGEVAIVAVLRVADQEQ